MARLIIKQPKFKHPIGTENETLLAQYLLETVSAVVKHCRETTDETIKIKDNGDSYDITFRLPDITVNIERPIYFSKLKMEGLNFEVGV